MDNVAIKIAEDRGNGPGGSMDDEELPSFVICIAQILCFFKSKFTDGGMLEVMDDEDDGIIECAFVWWYTLDEEAYMEDSTGGPTLASPTN